MKVTAIIPDNLVQETIELSQASSVTEALKIALVSYIRSQKIKKLGSNILNEPLEFKYSAQELRDLNRK
ncbi:hypothetical protein C943_02077 [Mariniradius saccharolyticus AK6]|uniref:DUF2191 domain-containing protein n=1 Tax=Mariniradius saccharolyticus AK6 TaxID=1239962 RepID=M7XSD8_9BACT|nr:DUF2191 domain-containing protein [Mariniradius saccharolyticus]EMS31422.1 hypothetical protein C943_02077 [Mariniradius saccharolyticus AK6]